VIEIAGAGFNEQDVVELCKQLGVDFADTVIECKLIAALDLEVLRYFFDKKRIPDIIKYDDKIYKFGRVPTYWNGLPMGKIRRIYFEVKF
jgi:hypothetical protein